MKPSTNESIHERMYQPYPQQGKLFNNLNLSLDKLCQKVGPEQAIVYFYVIATVKNQNDNFIQTGSAPNFQGDWITLCTCKHYMRTFLGPAEWKGKWVAGFTGLKAGGGSNALVYLTKIGYAFESHHDLWFSEVIPSETKQAKVATLHRFGDIFQPSQPGDMLDQRNYHPPCHNHVHGEPVVWHKDIDYRRNGRQAALLAGSPENSFLWNKPTIFYSGQIGRGQRKLELKTLLSQLTIGDAP